MTTTALATAAPTPAPVLQLRSLVAADWDPAYLTGQLGWDVVAILHHAIPITPQLAEDIATLYDRHAGRMGTNSVIGQRARSRGWTPAPPLPDSDDPREMAAGYRRRREAVGLTLDERVDAVRRLARMHLSDAQIAEVIGASQSAVFHLRRRYRIKPGVPPGRPPRVDLDTHH